VYWDQRLPDRDVGRITPLSYFPLILMQRDTSVRAIVGAGFHAAGLMPEATCEAIYMMTAVGMVRWAIMREERHEDSVHQR
jgi:hypothetical protein